MVWGWVVVCELNMLFPTLCFNHPAAFFTMMVGLAMGGMYTRNDACNAL